MEIEPLAEKWRSFGWEVFECDGNDIEVLCNTFDLVEKVKGKPSVIIAKTKMGKGVKPIEDDYRWHGKAPGKAEAKEFIKYLNSNYP
jgi:transketolase